MNGRSLEDVEKTIKKVTKTPFTAIFALVMSIVFLISTIVGLVLISGNFTLAIVLILSTLPLSIIFFLIFFFQKRRNKRVMEKVDYNEIRRELSEGYDLYDAYSTYFTKNYMISHYYRGFIVKYTDILWVYSRHYFDPSKSLEQSDLAICLRDGSKEFLGDVKGLIDEIVKHNPNVMVGNTKENKNRYKELVKNSNN